MSGDVPEFGQAPGEDDATTIARVRWELHRRGGRGYLPCTREWPHDGPCAHPERPWAFRLRWAVSLWDVVSLAAVLIAGLFAGLWDRITGRHRRDPVPVWPDVGWAVQEVHVAWAPSDQYLSGWTSDGEGGIYMARALLSKCGGAKRVRSKREARRLILQRLELRVAVGRVDG